MRYSVGPGDSSECPVMKCYFSSMPGPASGQACGREVGVQFSFRDQVSDNHAVRNWTFDFLSHSSLWQSCSQELDVLKLQQPHIFQFRLTFLTIMQSGIWSPFSFQVKTSDHHAVRIWYSGFLQQPHKFEDSWYSHHLFAMSRRFAGRPPPLSTHPSGKYWGKPPALTPPGHKGKGKLFPHQRSPYVTLSTTAICGKIWETFATGRAMSRQWKSLLAKWRPPIGTLCYWTNLLSRSS